MTLLNGGQPVPATETAETTPTKKIETPTKKKKKKTTESKAAKAKPTKKKKKTIETPTKKTKAKTTEPTPTDLVPFNDAVKEAKAIVAKMADEERRGQLRLGALADKLDPVYGDRTIAKFAKAIGLAACTLRRYREVFREWDGAGKCAPGRISYAVMRELKDHPKRAELVSDNPRMTKAEARDLMREHRGRGSLKFTHPIGTGPKPSAGSTRLRTSPPRLSAWGLLLTQLPTLRLITKPRPSATSSGNKQSRSWCRP